MQTPLIKGTLARGLFMLAMNSFSLVTGRAEAQVLRGSVVSNGQAVPFANVGLLGTTYGTSADIEGRFQINKIPAGNYVLVASAVGFESEEREIEMFEDQSLTINFELKQVVLEVDEVVVTGSLIETYAKDSPVKVDVVSPSYLEKIPSSNIMEVLENVNGLYQQIDCAVCGTNNIRINGMDGPYMAVLIDGMPIMSSLATVYALNGISPALIQQVEIIKGPMSTLYGSEAMGGVINIITKNPELAPFLTLNTFATSDAEFSADFAMVPARGRFSSLISATVFHNDKYLDRNGDGFADMTLNSRLSLFGKAAMKDAEGNPIFNISGRYYNEDRLGGVKNFVRGFEESLRGSNQVYGETIRTDRIEIVGSLFLSSQSGPRLDLAYNFHDQDSFYGDLGYNARQTTGFTQLLWPIQIDKSQSILFGAAMRLQKYDDNTGSTGIYSDSGELRENLPDSRLVPGLFVQYETVPSKSLRLLSGLRLDYQKDTGIVASPRISLKLTPNRNTTLRLNGGTGFRIVNLFTEDHAAYTGARATVLLENLRPERSINATLGLQHVVPFGANPLTIDIEGFYTYFTNKIEPNYDVPGLIQYENLEGSATTRGISLTLSQSMTALPLNYTLGVTLMDVFVNENDTRLPLEFAPDYQAVANLTYRLPQDFAVDYTMNLTGPMALPEYEAPFNRPSTSPTFSTHNVQLNKEFDLRNGPIVQTYLSVENVFNYTQADPLIDPRNPFGENFDTAYVYGPLVGRSFGFGARLMLR